MAGGKGKGVHYSDESKERTHGLTTREGEVLEYAARGDANKDIADRLSINVRTIEKHFEKIFAKLHVQSRSAAIYLYYESLLDGKTRMIKELQQENARLRRRLARMKRAT